MLKHKKPSENAENIVFEKKKSPGLEVVKIKRNDWLLVDTCPQVANHCALF